MQKGDKFIVVDNSGSEYNVGDIIELFEYKNSMYSLYKRSDNLRQYLAIYKIKPLDRFPCDDEQVDN